MFLFKKQEFVGLSFLLVQLTIYNYTYNYALNKLIAVRITLLHNPLNTNRVRHIDPFAGIR